MKDIFLLDLDDTLVDFPRAERENFFATLAQCGIKADGRAYARFHAINDGLWRSLERGEIAREPLKVRRFALLFEELGISADPGQVSAAYVSNFAKICFPFDGSHEFLAELAARGRVYLVTNGGTELQHSHIRLAGFGPYLSGVFISEEIGADKPSPAFARYAEAHIDGYARERAVWIGDSLTSDMVCAKSVGVDFILYLPHTVSTDYTGYFARNYGEVLQILGVLGE